MLIHCWNEKSRQLHFVGFNREFTAALLTDGESRRALRLGLPQCPDLHWRDNPIKTAAEKSELTEILRSALHLPICAATKAEAREIREFGFFAWQKFVLHDCFLTPDDDQHLHKRLSRELDQLRKSRPHREREAIKNDAASMRVHAAKGKRRISVLEDRLQEEQIDPQISPSRLQGIRLKFANWLRTKRANYRSGRSRRFHHFIRRNDKDSFVDESEITLEDVKDGAFGLRDQYLNECWAEIYGIELQQLPLSASAFRDWLSRHAYNQEENRFHANIRQWRTTYGMSDNENLWEALEAAVRYEMRFKDGNRCWLDRIELSDKLTPDEVSDFDRLLASSEADGDRWMSRDDSLAFLSTVYGGETHSMSEKQFRNSYKKLFQKAPSFPVRKSELVRMDSERNAAKKKRAKNLPKTGHRRKSSS